MRIGLLDQRITIQDPAETQDGGGGVTKVWSNIATAPNVWASVKASRGSEAFQEDRTNATAMMDFTIRNRSDFDETARIVWDGINYNIRAIHREGSRALYLTITAERGVSN